MHGQRDQETANNGKKRPGGVGALPEEAHNEGGKYTRRQQAGHFLDELEATFFVDPHVRSHHDSHHHRDYHHDAARAHELRFGLLFTDVVFKNIERKNRGNTVGLARQRSHHRRRKGRKRKSFETHGQ